MGYQLQFAKRALYDVGQPGISIPVTLRLGNRFAVLDAKLDTGATDCVFARKYAEQLDLKVEQGQHVRMGTATGSFTVWRHEITLEVLGYSFDARGWPCCSSGWPRGTGASSGGRSS
jgi:hypothetical protein